MQLLECRPNENMWANATRRRSPKALHQNIYAITNQVRSPTSECGCSMLPEEGGRKLRTQMLFTSFDHTCTSAVGSAVAGSKVEEEAKSLDRLRDRRDPASPDLLSRILRRCCLLFMACSRLYQHSRSS